MTPIPYPTPDVLSPVPSRTPSPTSSRRTTNEHRTTASSQPLDPLNGRLAIQLSVLGCRSILPHSTVSAIIYATSDDFSGHVDQSAMNAAFDGHLHPHRADHHDDDGPAGASERRRAALALSTYVHSAIVIAVASVICGCSPWLRRTFSSGSLEYSSE